MIEHTESLPACVTSLNLPELNNTETNDVSPSLGIAVLNDIEVQLEIRLGRASLKVKDLLALKSGVVLSLDQRLDQDVEVLLNGKIIALGALISVDGHFGVHITQTFIETSR